MGPNGEERRVVSVDHDTLIRVETKLDTLIEASGGDGFPRCATNIEKISQLEIANRWTRKLVLGTNTFLIVIIGVFKFLF